MLDIESDVAEFFGQRLLPVDDQGVGEYIPDRHTAAVVDLRISSPICGDPIDGLPAAKTIVERIMRFPWWLRSHPTTQPPIEIPQMRARSMPHVSM